jgi:hypothetical protein
VALSDIATVLRAVGGAAVTALFATEALFAWYSIGLAVGFFAYFIIGWRIHGKQMWAAGWGISCFTCKIPLLLSGRCWDRTSDLCRVKAVR